MLCATANIFEYKAENSKRKIYNYMKLQVIKVFLKTRAHIKWTAATAKVGIYKVNGRKLNYDIVWKEKMTDE